MSEARRILYLQYTNPACYPSLEHSSRILAEAGWEVLFLGTGGLGVDALRFPPDDRITVRQLPFRHAGWRQKLQYLGFCVWALVWALRWRPRWVYCSDPLSCPVALALTVLPGVRLIYHEHDSPTSGNGGLQRNSRFARFVLWSRRRVARRAALCILPNQQRMARFVGEMGNGPTVSCVWNCPSLEEVRPSRAPSDGRLTVYYHGNIGPGYLPPSVLKAVAMLRGDLRLWIIGYETISTLHYRDFLKGEARRFGIGDCVEFLEPMPRYRLMKMCAESDVGLALVPRNDGDVNNLHMTGASNKPFDYLACGLALLVSDLPDWRRLYVDPGYGLACDPDDPKSIAAALRWFLEHPNEMRAMGERGRQRIAADWHYERRFAPVLELMYGMRR